MMEEIVIKVGDLFVYKSKYGGVVKGTIAAFNMVTHVDTTLGMMVKGWKIRSTKGVWYELNEIELVSRWLSEAGCKRLANTMKVLSENKKMRIGELRARHDEYIKNNPMKPEKEEDI